MGIGRSRIYSATAPASTSPTRKPNWKSRQDFNAVKSRGVGGPWRRTDLHRRPRLNLPSRGATALKVLRNVSFCTLALCVDLDPRFLLSAVGGSSRTIAGQTDSAPGVATKDSARSTAPGVVTDRIHPSSPQLRVRSRSFPGSSAYSSEQYAMQGMSYQWKFRKERSAIQHRYNSSAASMRSVDETSWND
jgi:hypothetical protein